MRTSTAVTTPTAAPIIAPNSFPGVVITVASVVVVVVVVVGAAVEVKVVVMMVVVTVEVVIVAVVVVWEEEGSKLLMDVDTGEQMLYNTNRQKLLSSNKASMSV